MEDSWWSKKRRWDQLAAMGNLPQEKIKEQIGKIFEEKNVILYISDTNLVRIRHTGGSVKSAEVKDITQLSS